MTLREANLRTEYIVKSVNIDDPEIVAFLFSLGLYSGEAIAVIQIRKSGCIIAIKDAKYSIDNSLAEKIII